MLPHNEGACDEGEDAEEEGNHGVIRKRVRRGRGGRGWRGSAGCRR
jgi:hypothetical protein